MRFALAGTPSSTTFPWSPRAGVSPRPVASLLGLEHEYEIRRGGRIIDFGTLLHELTVDGARLDPGDPAAYRCRWGGALTVDGREAELAAPPVDTRPGFTRRLDAWARRARRELDALLPPGYEATGYSTHLSAAYDGRRAVRFARRYGRTFGPALMLLMDGPSSPGLLVRPRPRRLELGGEYVSELRLRAASAFVAGSTRALAAADTRDARSLLPSEIELRDERARERFGFYVDRGSFGLDLYEEGRGALLRRRRGGTITAQEHLEECWAIARDALHDVADEHDLADADALVAGALPLAIEELELADYWDREVDLDDVYGRAITPRTRDGFTLRAVVATWELTVYEVTCSSTGRTAFLNVPLEWLHDFLSELECGELDGPLRTSLASPPRDRILAAASDATTPGVFDRLGSPDDLLAKERDPLTGRSGGGRGFGPRRGKRRRDHRPRGNRSLRALVTGAAITAAVVLGVVLVAGGSGDDEPSRPAAGGDPQPAVLGPDDLVLAADGLGVVDFGAPDAEVIATLTDLLGEPDERVEGTPGSDTGFIDQVRWSHLSVIFTQGTFTEYHFSQDGDLFDGTIDVWNPAPWEEDLETEEGVGIGTPRAEAESAYPIGYLLLFQAVEDDAQGFPAGGPATCFNDVTPTPRDGLGTFSPAPFFVRQYVEPQRQGLWIDPLIDDTVWRLGATHDGPGFFCVP
jgi:hypothetical protein